MPYTFNSGKGHVTAYSGSCWAYVRKNVFGYWRTVEPSKATHVINTDPGDHTPRPYTYAPHWFV